MQHFQPTGLHLSKSYGRQLHTSSFLLASKARSHYKHLAAVSCSNCNTSSAPTSMVELQPHKQQGWSAALTAAYLTQHRDWRAVEAFYIDLVAGRTCLSALGLAPAGAAAHTPQQQQQQLRQQQHKGQQDQQQQQTLDLLFDTAGQLSVAVNKLPRQQDYASKVRAPVLEEQQLQDKPPPRRFERTTYKVQVSYLGSSFSGWVRQPGKISVEETLAAAIAAAGLTAEPLNFVSKSAKAAAKQARRAALKQFRAQANCADGRQRQHCQQLMQHQHQSQQLQPAAVPSTTPPSSIGLEVSASSTPAVLPVLVRADADGAVDGAGAAGGPRQGSVTAKLPVLPCGGRTDAGVSAAGQVVSFYSWHPHTSSTNIVTIINQHLEQMLKSPVSSTGPQVPSKRTETGEDAAPTASAANCSSEASRSVLPAGSQLRVVSAQQVDPTFHAAFSAHWRRYVYLLPLKSKQHHTESSSRPQQQGPVPGSSRREDNLLPLFSSELQQSRKFECLEADELLQLQQAPDVDPEAVNTLLQQLQGRTLDYNVYARDTPAGKDCNCILHTARASVVALPPDHRAMQPAHPCKCLCIELVGNRFLRRMVRVLVATAVREALPSAAAAAGSSGSPLEAMMAPGGDRRVTAAPAPALGLCFAAVGYADTEQ